MKAKTLKRRAISPLIATIILIAICISGGLLVYSVFFSTAGTLSAKGQVTVEAMDLVKNTEGHVNFSIVVKNTGNKPVTTLAVTLNGETAAQVTLPSPSNVLQPGQSASYSASALAKEYVVGNNYNVVIEATFSDGSTFATTTSVNCRSG
jgi:flagellin-like protein